LKLTDFWVHFFPNFEYMIIEVACSNIESCVAAQSAGADRIELFSVLDSGGVTPSIGLVMHALSIVKIPVKVLIRPREGGFVYSALEIEVMLNDIKCLVQLGVAGVVSGVLNRENQVDEETLKCLVAAAGPVPFTFFRAIDVVSCGVSECEKLVNAGCAAVLTSGGGVTVEDGKMRILEMQRKFKDRLTIVAGGGLTIESGKELLQSGINEFHLSGKQAVMSGIANELFDCRHFEVSKAIISDFVTKMKF